MQLNFGRREDSHDCQSKGKQCNKYYLKKNEGRSGDTLSEGIGMIVTQ